MFFHPTTVYISVVSAKSFTFNRWVTQNMSRPMQQRQRLPIFARFSLRILPFRKSIASRKLEKKFKEWQAATFELEAEKEAASFLFLLHTHEDSVQETLREIAVSDVKRFETYFSREGIDPPPPRPIQKDLHKNYSLENRHVLG